MVGRCLRCCVVPVLAVFGECAVFYYGGRLRLFKYCMDLWLFSWSFPVYVVVMLLWLAGFHWHLQLLFASPAWF